MEKFLHKTGPWCQEVLRWLIYTMEYYAAERKKKDFLVCDSMDGTGDDYAKWNKPDVKDKYHMISLISGI